MLVAKAWHPDYYEGCFVIPKDGDKKNIHVDNLEIVEPDEFYKWRGERTFDGKKPKKVDWAQYGEFKKTSIDGLECTIDGVFRKNHRVLKVNYHTDSLGRKRQAEISCNVNGSRRILSAAKIIAQTWSPNSWFDGCMIWYKDGNKHNIHSDNLILVDEKKFYNILGLKNKPEPMTFEQSYERIKRRAKEAEIALKYFETGDFSDINIYVEKELLPLVVKYTLSQGFSLSKTNVIITEVISVLYEYIMAYRPITHYYLFCQRLIRIYKKTNGFGFYERMPNPLINKNVSLLKIESLCEKYRCTKIK